MAKKPEKILRLKPGRHQFVPGVNSFHDNDNTTSDEIRLCMKVYPHIKDMLESPEEEAKPEASE